MIVVIKFDDLREEKRYQVSDGGNAVLEDVATILSEKNEHLYGIPLEIKIDMVKTGGLLKSQTEPCLILEHPNHKSDYLNWAITMNVQGRMAFITLFSFGKSKLLGKEAQAGIASSAGGMSGKIFGKVLGPNRVKLQEERDYYAGVVALFNSIFE